MESSRNCKQKRLWQRQESLWGSRSCLSSCRRRNDVPIPPSRSDRAPLRGARSGSGPGGPMGPQDRDREDGRDVIVVDVLGGQVPCKFLFPSGPGSSSKGPFRLQKPRAIPWTLSETRPFMKTALLRSTIRGNLIGIRCRQKRRGSPQSCVS